MFSDHGGIKLEITKEDEKTMYQNIWDEGKMVLRGKFIALNAHVGKEGRSQINHLGFYVKKPERDPDCCGSAGWASNHQAKGHQIRVSRTLMFLSAPLLPLSLKTTRIFF